MKTKYFFIAVASVMLSMPNVMAQDNQQPEGKARVETRTVRVRNGQMVENSHIVRQGMPMNREKMKEMQVNQVINTLMLDDATAAKFKTVYENYLKELADARTIGMKKKADQPKEKAKEGESKDKTVVGKPREPMTDAQIEEGIKNRFAQSRKMLDVREKYYTEFKKYLTPKQILKVYQLEKNNGQKIQKEFRKRMRNDKNMGGRPAWGNYDAKKNADKNKDNKNNKNK